MEDKSQYSGNPVLDPNEYIQSRTPNKVELANLIVRAKGKNRTMADFAQACGVSSTMFSRIANEKIVQPVSFDVLVQICLNSAPESRVYMQELTIANGMVLKEFAEEKDRKGEGKFQRDEKRFSLENEMKNVITSALLNRGVGIRTYKRIEDPSVHTRVRNCGRPRLVIQTDGYEPLYLRFEMMAPVGVRRGDKAFENEDVLDAESEILFMFNNVAEIFLLDIWEKEGLKNVQHTFVFHDREMYNEFLSRVGDNKVNNWFSVLLVDVKAQTVIEECYIPRFDGESKSSIFDLPILQSDDTEEWW